MPQVLQDGGSAVLVDFEDGRQPRWIPRAQWEQMNGGATPSPAEITMGPNNAQEPIYQDDATGVSISPVTTVPDPAFVSAPQAPAAPAAPVEVDAVSGAAPIVKPPGPLNTLGLPVAAVPEATATPEKTVPPAASGANQYIPPTPQEQAAATADQHLAEVGKTAQGTINSAIAGTRGATLMGVEAINKEAEAKAKQAEDEAKAWDETIQKNAGIEEAFSKVDTENRKRVLDSWNDTKAAADKYAAMEIDPDRYVKGRSTFQKIMMGISVALGAGAQVAMGRNAQGGMAMPTNPGIDMINDAIDKDVQLQIASINKAGKVVDMRRNLFTDARLIAGDDQDRYKLLVAAEQRRVANGLNAIGAKHASPIVKAQADKAAAALILDSNKTMADLAYKGGMLDARDAAIAAKAGRGKGSGSGATKGESNYDYIAREFPDLPKKEYGRVVFLNGKPHLAKTEDAAKKLSEAVPAREGLYQILNEMYLLREASGWESNWRNKEVKQKMDALYGRFTAKVKSAEKLGAYDNGVEKLAAKLVGDPSGWKDIQGQIVVMREGTQADVDGELEMAGIAPGSWHPPEMGKPSARQVKDREQLIQEGRTKLPGLDSFDARKNAFSNLYDKLLENGDYEGARQVLKDEQKEARKNTAAARVKVNKLTGKYKNLTPTELRVVLGDEEVVTDSRQLGMAFGNAKIPGKTYSRSALLKKHRIKPKDIKALREAKQEEQESMKIEYWIQAQLDKAGFSQASGEQRRKEEKAKAESQENMVSDQLDSFR